jgi:hypothetical protein
MTINDWTSRGFVFFTAVIIIRINDVIDITFAFSVAAVINFKININITISLNCCSQETTQASSFSPFGTGNEIAFNQDFFFIFVRQMPACLSGTWVRACATGAVGAKSSEISGRESILPFLSRYILFNQRTSCVKYTLGVLRVELSFFERFDRGARVTHVTMLTARYLATRNILENIKNQVENYHIIMTMGMYRIEPPWVSICLIQTY